MASVMELRDFHRLLPFFDLELSSDGPPPQGDDPLFLTAVCPSCGLHFAIELLDCEGDILFNFEDLLCPTGCNRTAVSVADFHEQLQFESVEDFFCDPMEEPLRQSLRVVMNMLPPASDN